MTSQYENPKLWKRVGSATGKRYASVPAEVPKTWKREHGLGVMIYRSGEYELRGRCVSGSRRRHWTVWRQGVELPLSLTGLLREARARAEENARGEDRMNVA